MGLGNTLLAFMAFTFLLSALLHAFIQQRRPWLLAALTLFPTLMVISIDKSVISTDRFHILLLVLLGTGFIATFVGIAVGLGLQILERALKR